MEDLGQSLCLAQLGLRRKRPHKLDVTPHRVACCHACERIGVIVLAVQGRGAPSAGIGSCGSARWCASQASSVLRCRSALTSSYNRDDTVRTSVQPSSSSPLPRDAPVRTV